MNLQVSPAHPEERPAALRLFFQHVDEEARVARVEKALALIAQGELPEDGLLVCRSPVSVVGAITALPMAGSAGLVWPPQVDEPGEGAAIEDALLESALRWLRQRGARFVQSLLADADVPFAEPFFRHGFEHTTTLVYLQKSLTPQDAHAGDSSRLRYQSYPHCDASLFNALLLESYHDTLDCPELNDLRSGDEVLAGYRAVPGCQVERWWLAWHEDKAVGVLVSVPSREPATWELSYVGLAPSARRQGFGTEMTRKALADAYSVAATRLTLTVDARNEPARRMYRLMGFEEFDRREVMLTVFSTP